jgi:hypothetical protein
MSCFLCQQAFNAVFSCSVAALHWRAEDLADNRRNIGVA